MVVSGLPKMTPSLNDSLEELTGLRSCYTHVIVYYGKRMQIKISEGKCAQNEVQENQMQASRYLLHGVAGTLNSPSNDV